MKKLLFVYIFLMGVFVLACEKDTIKEDGQELTDQNLVDEIVKELSGADSISNFKDYFKDLKLSKQDVEKGITIFVPVDYTININNQDTKVNIVYTENDLKNHIVKGLHFRSSFIANKRMAAISGKQLEVSKLNNITRIDNIIISGDEVKVGKNVVIHFVARALGYEYPDELEITPTPITEQSFLTALSAVEVRVNDFHNNILVADALMSNELKADSIARIGFSSFWEFDRFGFNASTNIISQIWDKGFSAVNSINVLIKNVPSSLSNIEEKVAELRIMRAYLYMQLQAYFQNIPVVPEVIDYSEPTYLYNNDKQKVVDFIQTDLAEAEKRLSKETSPANYYTVKALMARMAIREKKYNQAKLYTNEIINSGKFVLENRSSAFELQSRELIWVNKISLETAFKRIFHNRVMNPFVRLSEIYLINGESNINLGNTETALLSLKPIFQKHGITESTELEALRDLWLREMNREGISFINLVRWGVASEKLKDNGFKSPKNNALPIPMKEMSLNRYFIQNFGYEN